MVSIGYFWEFQGVSYTMATCACPLFVAPSESGCVCRWWGLGGRAGSCCGEVERGAVSLPRREGGCASARGAELLFPLSFPCGGTVQELGGRAPPCPRPRSGSAAGPGAPGSGLWIPVRGLRFSALLPATPPLPRLPKRVNTHTHTRTHIFTLFFR